MENTAKFLYNDKSDRYNIKQKVLAVVIKHIDITKTQIKTYGNDTTTYDCTSEFNLYMFS